MTNFLLIVLVGFALYAAAGPQILEQLRKAAGLVGQPQIERRHLAAAAALAAAAVLWNAGRDEAAPTPAPGPAPGALDLRGTFVGPDASADAATTAAYLDEVAAELEWDGMQPDPFFKTGVMLDELRIRARELRTKGVSLGEKHPRAREAIKNYLDTHAGKSGGPLTPEQRSAWVSAFREVARAAADAAR
jgi:hypothetical protein